MRIFKKKNNNVDLPLFEATNKFFVFKTDQFLIQHFSCTFKVDLIKVINEVVPEV